MRRERKFRIKKYDDDSDPLSGMANLFDVAMVFAVALMVAIVVHFNMTDLLTKDEMTMIKNPGKKDMEIIIKKGKKITKYKASGASGKGKGRRVGVAYELDDGQIIYVPE